MKKITLVLIRKWFDMIYSGIKHEEYRQITPYWCNKFLLDRGDQMPKKWWEIHLQPEPGYNPIEFIKEGIKEGELQFVNIYAIEFAHAYKNDRDKFTVHFEGFEIREGNPEWGAEKGTEYFVLKVKNIICSNIVV
jgi:hypothetical protein